MTYTVMWQRGDDPGTQPHVYGRYADAETADAAVRELTEQGHKAWRTTRNDDHGRPD